MSWCPRHGGSFIGDDDSPHCYECWLAWERKRHRKTEEKAKMLSDEELKTMARELDGITMLAKAPVEKWRALLDEHAKLKRVTEHVVHLVRSTNVKSHTEWPTLEALLTAAGMLQEKATIAGLLNALHEFAPKLVGCDWVRVGEQNLYPTKHTATELAYARGERMVVTSEVTEGLWMRFFSGEHVTKTTHTEEALAARDIKSFLGGA